MTRVAASAVPKVARQDAPLVVNGFGRGMHALR
jgi:hypothetical protein